MKTTYTLSEFINRINNRKNIKRNSNVIVDFTRLKNSAAHNEYVFTDYSAKYIIYIYKESNNKYIIGVLINKYEYDIGYISWPLNSDEKTVTVKLDCDVAFV